MRKRFALCVAGAAAVAALAPPAPALAAPIEIGHIPRCVEGVPAAIAIPPGRPINLDTRVLLDGVGGTRGRRVFERARKAYSPLGINLVPRFRSVSFKGTNADRLIAQSKALYGGRRPAWSDVVYTLTRKDIQLGGDDAVAGLADCIGGVAFARRAFAVGENFTDDESILVAGLPALARNLTAKVAAHEIGHLMGAHHHHANCAEGLLSESLASELSPCTLMFNAVDLASINFSGLEGLVVRGHAEAYARP